MSDHDKPRPTPFLDSALLSQTIAALEAQISEQKLQLTTLQTDMIKLQQENTALQLSIDCYRTQQKQVEATLINTESFYQALIQKAPDGVVLINQDGLFAFASPSARRMFGFAENGALDAHPAEYTHPEDLSAVLEALNDVIIHPEHVRTLEYRFRDVDGTWRWIESTFSNLFDEPGVNGIVINFRNISERKGVEQALKASESKYRTLVETMSEGVVCVDNDDTIQYINQRCCDMYGYKPEDLLGKTGYDYLVHKEDRHIIVAKNKSRLSGEMDSYEVRGTRLSGETIWVKISGAPVLDNENRVVGSVGIMSDITAHKALEAQLISAHKMEAIGQLAGCIAHDFNNLLTVILGYSEELCSHLTPDNPLFHNAEEILKAGNRASSLTKQLLTFSRKQVIQPQVLNLNAIVTETYTMLRRLIGEHIKIDTVLSPQARLIKADVGHVEQVIVNLVLNARDAMPEGGRISLSTSQAEVDVPVGTDDFKSGTYTLLTVTDTGHGMDSESQKVIFEPFYTTKKKGKGLGLGLFNVYWIVKQCGGQIKVQSEPGKGTAIQVWFPVSDETLAVEYRKDSGKVSLGGGESILIVEDEEALCTLIRQIVSELGYKVTTCSNGTAAWSAIQKGLQPDLIITDIMMPSMNGKELADRVWAANPQQKILFMSGFTDDTFGHPDVSAIRTLLIQKPFTMCDIAYHIQKILGTVASIKPRKATILILDDDANIRLFVKRAGKARGHDVLEAATPEAALVTLSQNQVDMIMLDLQLDGVSGIVALQDIRQAGFDQPVIAFTGALNQDMMDQLTPLGVVTAMEKSFDYQPLFHYIEEWIQNS